MAFSADGKTLAIGSKDGTIHLWDVPTCEPRLTLQRAGDKVLSLAFSPDGKTLASGHEQTIRLWDLATGMERATLESQKPCWWAFTLAFSPDGKTLASAGLGTIKLWDLPTGMERATLRGDGSSLAFSPDGKVLASLGGDSDLAIVWEVATGKKLCTIDPGDQEYVDDVAFSPGGRTLALAYSGSIQLWDTTSGKKTASYSWFPSRDHFQLCSIQFTPDGELVALGSCESVVTRWGVPFIPIKRSGVLAGVAAVLLLLGVSRRAVWSGHRLTKSGEGIAALQTKPPHGTVPPVDVSLLLPGY
jgi:WD40 repeat protein